MQDLNPTPLENEKHSGTTQIRHGDALFDLIERASVSLAVEKSVFLRYGHRPWGRACVGAANAPLSSPLEMLKHTRGLWMRPRSQPHEPKRRCNYTETGWCMQTNAQALRIGQFDPSRHDRWYDGFVRFQETAARASVVRRIPVDNINYRLLRNDAWLFGEVNPV